MRDLRNTAPYMHNGSLKSLNDVVEFYDQKSSLSPLRLTDAEIADLVAYLESL
jgi:cytochrome c peroxidase